MHLIERIQRAAARLKYGLAAAALIAVAAAPFKDTPATNDEPAAGPIPAGRVAFVDPKTGELRTPTPEERRAFFDQAAIDALAKSGEPMEVEVRADGSRRLRAEGRIRAAASARIGDDGQPRVDCATEHTASARGDVQ